MVQAGPSGMTTPGLPLATTAPVEVEVEVDCVTTLPEGGEVIFQEPRQGQKRKRNTKTQDDELQLRFLENLEKLHQSLSAENDEDGLFAKSIAAELRKMSPRKKIRTKAAIFNCLANQ